MATGTPKRAQNSKSETVLAYEGKRDPADILAEEHPETHPVWNHGNADNRLYFGDNLAVLKALRDDEQVAGKVRLVYIDPPFATQSAFHSRKLARAYDDNLSGAHFVEFLRERLILLHDLLAKDGSLYLHLDEKMIFHAKLILDEIFGSGNYRNMIVRKKCNPKNFTRNTFGNMVDFILFYTKSESYVWNKQYDPWTESRAKEYQYVEEGTGRRFMKVPVHAPGVRKGETGGEWRGMMPPPGKHWQYRPSKLDEMDARGKIFWSSNGNPRRKVYLDESPGVSIQDVWLDFRDAHNQNVKITGYPTEKNPELLKRIINASSDPGDLVLDCFSGSGTTLAVADMLGRKWIGVDSSQEAIRTTIKRFQVGTEAMGDFVGKRAKKTSKNGNGNQETLFDLEAGGGRGHKIAEFVLFSEAGKEDSALSALNGWKEIGEASDEALKMAGVALSQKDPRIAELVKEFGPCRLRKAEDPFAVLVECIIGQQLSKKAAKAILAKVEGLFPKGMITAKSLDELADEKLRDAGVSSRKLEYLRSLRSQMQNGELDLASLEAKEEEEAISELIKVKGIGRWTAEMYLIFALNQLDVFPVDDAAVISAMKKIYGIRAKEPKMRAVEIAQNWKPYRSVACWYLYRSIDAQTE